MDRALRGIPVLIAAALSAVAPAASGPADPAFAAGDFAPLAVGNRWIYSGEDRGGGFWWNYTLRNRIQRGIAVDSVRDVPGGRDWYLSYRDSLHHREHSGADPQPPDSVLGGRFRVADRAGAATLGVHPVGGDYLPPELASFFRARALPGTGDTARLGLLVPRLWTDTCSYVRGVGLARMARAYDVWNTVQYTPPYRWTDFRLVEFRGSAPETAARPALPDGRVTGFAGLRPGRTWRWRALKRRVLTSGRMQVQDSLDRSVRVTGRGGLCAIAVRDSLFARTRGDARAEDTVETASLEMPCDGTSGNAPFSAFPAESGQADLRRFFGVPEAPAAMLETLDLPGGPVEAFVLRDGMPGLFTDTLVYARGIGFIRRAKLLHGLQGMTERMEYELVELDGKPFKAVASGIRRTAIGKAGTIGRRGQRPTDALGRSARPGAPFNASR